MPETVIGPSLVGLLQDVVGLLDLLKLLLSALVPRVDVGVEFAGETAVRLLDFRLGSPLRNPQNLVIVALFHELPGL
jgi:hypothetical protein